MSAYFLDISINERKNIMEQHNRTAYDGLVRMQQTNNQTPLYVEDLAKDKEGITVNGKGDVMNYRNYNINEAKKKCKKCGLNEEVCKCKKSSSKKCKKCGLKESLCECGNMNESDEIEGFTGKFDYTEENIDKITESFNRFFNFKPLT